LSDAEADHIISVAKPRVYKSTVGNSESGVRKSDTRTSSNTWVSRSDSEISNTLYLRAADVLNVDEKLLVSSRNAEDMQVVHYAVGEKYDAHHDWGVVGTPESRYITLLLYLNTLPDRLSGGETAFPKADGGHGIKVYPKKGTAVLFYSLLEDGNGDDLSLHQAMPVKKGEKWLANFWVWDPKKK
jgi:prolyl 4-hydroxylase